MNDMRQGAQAGGDGPCGTIRALYGVEQVRAFDAHAINALRVPGLVLMRRAAAAAWRALRQRWPGAQRVLVLTGGGNNGGDGFALASLGLAAGVHSSVLALVPPAQLRGDALACAQEFVSAGGVVQLYDTAERCAQMLAGSDVLVDALLGTGLREPVRAPFDAVIRALNASARPVLALDLPSGLDGDDGRVHGEAVRADCTVTFVAAKLGLYMGSGPERAGQIELDELGVPQPAAASSVPRAELLNPDMLARALPPRSRSAHKGDFGRVLLIGAGPGMPGAIRLAGESCLRCGAGLVITATAPQNVAAIATGRPELICIAAASAADLAPQWPEASVVAIGPGLGTGPWSVALFEAALACGKPLVIDADGLNLLAASGKAPPPGTVLTPHPGEAGRLLGCDSQAVQADRLGALERLVARSGAVVVLKGANTLIGAPGRIPLLCTHGNPGMAGPGMGDVLTGAVAAVLAQCRDPWLAAGAAVLAHALAGDELAQRSGARGILALDLAAALPRWINGVA